MIERQYHIDWSKPEKAARETIRMWIEQLEDLRPTTPQPEELEWQIRLYQFMLEKPLERLQEYQRTRGLGEGRRLLPKRDVVQRLGWVVP